MTTTTPLLDRAALAPRLRRLQRALGDLRLSPTVGDAWVRVGADGFEFGTLSDDAADRLALALEDLARRLDAWERAEADARRSNAAELPAWSPAGKVNGPARVPSPGAGAHMVPPA